MSTPPLKRSERGTAEQHNMSPGDKATRHYLGTPMNLDTELAAAANGLGAPLFPGAPQNGGKRTRRRKNGNKKKKTKTKRRKNLKKRRKTLKKRRKTRRRKGVCKLHGGKSCGCKLF
mgnify:CR=1 FL=1